MTRANQGVVRLGGRRLGPAIDAHMTALVLFFFFFFFAHL
jgi:hypothetical protein